MAASLQIHQDNRLYKLLLQSIPEYLMKSDETGLVFCPKIKASKDDDSGDDSSVCSGDSHGNGCTGADASNDDATTTVGFDLGIGEFKFIYKGDEIIATHKEVGHPVASFRSDPATRRDLTLSVSSATAQRSEDRCGLNALQRFVADVYLGSISKAKKGTFKIYRWNAGCEYWACEKTVVARPLESVIMDPVSKEKILTDMDDFLGKEAKDFYLKHGIPYRRSYLLHGKPGSGKTSLIQALAGHYVRSVCFLQPTNPKITDDGFKQAMNELPQKAIVVLEDIDSLFKKRSKHVLYLWE